MACVEGTTNLHSHLELKHSSSVAECSGNEAGMKQLKLGNYKKCSRAKNTTARTAEYIARDLQPISTNSEKVFGSFYNT